jgi:hypothetical protein
MLASRRPVSLFMHCTFPMMALSSKGLVPGTWASKLYCVVFEGATSAWIYGYICYSNLV